jgi:hypothetical protein
MSGSDQRAPQLAITDPKVCRSYLVGNCPHDLFTNTKNELGPCPKSHNEALKTEYQEADADQKRRWGFEFDYMRDMQHHIDSCNRKIDSAQRRLEKTPEEIRQTNALVSRAALSVSKHANTCPAQSYQRTHQIDRSRRARDPDHGRRRYGEHGRPGIHQAPHEEGREGGARTGAASTLRHRRPVGPSEAPSVRRLRCVS